MCQNGCFGGVFLVCQVMLTIITKIALSMSDNKMKTLYIRERVTVTVLREGVVFKGCISRVPLEYVLLFCVLENIILFFQNRDSSSGL